jgi:hypothetical protein
VSRCIVKARFLKSPYTVLYLFYFLFFLFILQAKNKDFTVVTNDNKTHRRIARTSKTRRRFAIKNRGRAFTTTLEEAGGREGRGKKKSARTGPDHDALLIAAGVFSPSRRQRSAPSISQFKIPEASAFNFSCKRRSCFSSGIVVVNGISLIRRQMP